MSKEQLETAKLMARMLRLETRLPYDFPFDLVDWLVEQAERVYELESDSYNAHLEGLLDRREQQIKRYREAIKECLERMNEGGAGTRTFVYETLKKALEVERNE